MLEPNETWKSLNETLLKLNDRNTISSVVRRAQFFLCRYEMIEKFDKENISNSFSRIFVKKIDRPHFSVLSFKTRVCIKTFHVLLQNFNARQAKSFMHSLSIFRYVGWISSFLVYYVGLPHFSLVCELNVILNYSCNEIFWSRQISGELIIRCECASWFVSQVIPFSIC